MKEGGLTMTDCEWDKILATKGTYDTLQKITTSLGNIIKIKFVKSGEEMYTWNTVSLDETHGYTVIPIEKIVLLKLQGDWEVETIYETPN